MGKAFPYSGWRGISKMGSGANGKVNIVSASIIAEFVGNYPEEILTDINAFCSSMFTNDRFASSVRSITGGDGRYDQWDGDLTGFDTEGDSHR